MANIIKLEQTCECCPEQYWAYKGSHIIGYIRLRWGHLTCDYLHNGRLTADDIRVLDKTFNERADDNFKGSFDTEEEREYWLNKCKEALLNQYNKLKKEITMATIRAYTTIEQSKKLAEILPIESADMCYPKDAFEYNYAKEPVCHYSGIGLAHPCWSLTALLGILPKGYSFILTKSFNGKDYYCKLDGKPIETMADNPVDACVAMIIRLNELKLL